MSGKHREAKPGLSSYLKPKSGKLFFRVQEGSTEAKRVPSLPRKAEVRS
jgi:hypothetical protein